MRPRVPVLTPRQVSDDARAPLVLLAALGLAAAIVIAAVVAVDRLGSDDNSGAIVGGVTETPRPSPTLIPPATSTPRPTESPSPTATPVPSSTPTPPPATAPTASPATTPSAPHGPVAAALWADQANNWWFGELRGDIAKYSAGQSVPLMVQWNGVAGQTYWARITYDCKIVDYLTGAQDWGRGVIYASHGPAKDKPDGAISVPDTPNFTADDDDTGVLTLYGAKFPVLPLPPTPGAACPGQRTLSLPVMSYGGQVSLLAGAHLAKGSGAASINVSVDGIGQTTVRIDASAMTG